ncbi:MAG: hypothetical protein ABSG54_17270 [Terriglobia bacterium]|jgi:hypothetical protein
MKAFYLLALTLALALPGSAQVNSEITGKMRQDLDAVARVGSVMVDGDVCLRIVTRRAKELMFAVDPRDQFVAGDNYDVDDAAFNATKKTLIRLSHLVTFPSDVNLWMPIEAHPGKIQMVVRNKNEMSQFWAWGAIYQDTIPQMESVLKTGQRVTVTEKPGWISVLAPVYSSLGEIVGVLESVTRAKIDAHENVK